MESLHENENDKRSVGFLLEYTIRLTVAGHFRIDPYREFLRPRSAARGRGLICFGSPLPITVTKMASDVLLENHAFVRRKGGQGRVRQHRGHSLNKHCEAVSQLRMIYL